MCIKHYKGLILILICFLSGCVSYDIQENYTLKPESEIGIIVGSMTQDSQSGTKSAYSIFYIQNKDGSPFKYVQSKEDAFFSRYKDSEFDDIEGRIFSLEAPAGHYKITGWQINNGTGMRIYPKEYADPIEFEVQAGKITYIGNFHMKMETGENIFGIDITAGGYPVIKDSFERDYAVFKVRYPNLRSTPYIKTIPYTGVWLKTKETATEIQTPPQIVPTR